MHRSTHLAARIQAGFTLIEVMIVVAIIAILSAVAYPAYTDYVRRGQLTEAFTMLSAARVQLEQYYQDNKTYSNGGNCGGNLNLVGERFTLNCVVTNGGQGFTLTATGSSGQVVGYDYTLNEQNQRSTTKFNGSDVPANACWYTKSTNSCN